MMGGKKQGMELNGISNLLILLSIVEQDFGHEHSIEDGEKAISDMKKQLEYLERYMVAYNKAVREGTQTPYWHDILANPKGFPLNNGK